jgi:SH3-like domain-containing protein
MRKIIALLALSALALPQSAVSQTQKKTPYWGSIAAGKARMRTGPGEQFPATWLYQRAGLPVKIIAIYGSWRKIEDPDGTQGWMQVNLLSADRTALFTKEIRPLREKPDPSAKALWRAEPGVIGRVSECAKGWCRVDVLGRMGYVEVSHIYGADAL